MNEIRFVRPHALALAEARARVEVLAEQMARDYALRCRWDSARLLRFERSGLHGQLALDEQQLILHVRLGLLLLPLRPTLEQAIADYLERGFC